MKKLGTIVTESSTKLEGMLLNTVIDMDRQIQYLFQPKSLNPKTGLPVDKFWISDSRVLNGIDIEMTELPYNILGTLVEDIATGYKGMVTSLILHINGCVHVEVRSDKILDETGTVGKPIDVDIRRIKGEAVPILNEEELDISRKFNPSPEEYPSYHRDI